MFKKWILRLKSCFKRIGDNRLNKLNEKNEEICSCKKNLKSSKKNQPIKRKTVKKRK
jgi:hypothetical protein